MNEPFLAAIEVAIRTMTKGDLRRIDYILNFDGMECKTTIELITNTLGCESINIRLTIEK